MKLLVIDVGNSTTVFGVFAACKLQKKWVLKTSDLLNILPKWRGEIVISSVVPQKNKIIRKKYSHAHFVTAENISGIKVKAKKAEVGADRVVNALAAKELYGSPVIVVDFGTATTFDVVSKVGEYLGGAIAPGIGLSAKVLHEATAKLPEIIIHASNKLIGKNTKEAINSGLLYGYVSLVEGMINRISHEPSDVSLKPKVIATGGFAKLISRYTKSINIVDPDLTLKGLRLAYLNLMGYNNKYGRRN